MKPVIPDFIPFTPDRVLAIRENRIQRLAEGLAQRDKKPRKARSAPRRKPITLTGKAQVALDGMDDDMKKFLMDAIK